MKIILVICLLLPNIIMAADVSPIPTNDSLSELTLSKAEQLWKSKNKEIQLMRDQVAGVDADRLTAAQRPNPQLSVNTGAIDTRRDAPGLEKRLFDNADIVVRLDQLVERGDKRQLRMRTANLNFDAAKFDLADSTRQGYILLYQSYYDLVLAQEKLRITKENALLYINTVKAAELRLRAGDIPASELSRIKVDALRAENNIEEAQNELSQSQLDLAYKIGAEQKAKSIVAVDSWPVIYIPEASDSSIENRPDMRAAYLKIKAAESGRDLANSLTIRDVTLGVQAERNGSNTPLHSIGFGVSIPLLTGYEYQGEIARADAGLQAARDSLDQTRAQAMTELSKARSDLDTAIRMVKRYDDDLLSEAGKSLQAAEFAYRHGSIGVMDLLDARRTNKATLLDAQVARSNYAKALIAWRLAKGEVNSSENEVTK